MSIETLLDEFEDKSLEELILSKEFQLYKDNLEYDWNPVAFKNRIIEQDLQDYLW